MKTFKDIISEIADPKPRREKAFKDKHVVQKIDHPVGEEDQFVATKIQKDKTKKASHHDGDDVAVYEEVEQIDEISNKTLTNYAKYSYNDILKRRANRPAGKGDESDPKIGKRLAMNKLANKKGAFKEEVEQIDEISQDKLYNYHAKAGADLQAKRKKLEQGKLTMQDLKKDQNRVTGLNRAADKMHEEMSDAEMKKREDIVKGMKKNKADFQKRYGDRWKSVMYATATKNSMKESVQELDELSKKTLGSYVKKAGGAGKNSLAHSVKSQMTAAHMGDKDDYKKSQRAANNRSTGIQRAADKMSEEVQDLDEAFKAGSMKLKDGSSATVTKESADVLNSLFKQLNSANKTKMEERLMSGTNGFNEILAFAKEAV